MILGRVTGHLWGARKVGQLTGRKLSLVRLERAYRYAGDHVVCVDDVGAEIGQQVIVCLGAPARWRLGGENMPVDAAVAAIVDQVSGLAGTTAGERRS